MGNDSPTQQEADALPSAGAGVSPPLPAMAVAPPLPPPPPADVPDAEPTATSESSQSTAVPPPPPTEDADAAIESRWSDLTTLYAEYDAAAGPGQTAPEPARPELTEVAP